MIDTLSADGIMKIYTCACVCVFLEFLARIVRVSSRCVRVNFFVVTPLQVQCISTKTARARAHALFVFTPPNESENIRVDTQTQF